MFSLILCGECGGEYVATDATETEWVCVEGSCLHTITDSDIVLDEGESLCKWADSLGYWTAEEVA